MSIADKTGQTDSITDGSLALKLFTNRNSIIKLFIEYLNEPKSRETILFLYGDSGNGKSILLQYLRKYFCKKLQNDDWEWFKKEFGEDELQLNNIIKESEENLEALAVAFLDFDPKITYVDRPKESFYGLLSLSRQLTSENIKFPLFNFACIWHLHRTKQLDQNLLKSLFPAEEMDFLAKIVDVITHTSYGSIGKAILSLVAKNVKTKYTIYFYKRGLGEDQIDQITQLDPEKELIEKLPDYFAQDLNYAMQQDTHPRRIVLLFDT